MSFIVLTPHEDTADKRPEALWIYDGQQEGFAVAFYQSPTSPTYAYATMVTYGPRKTSNSQVYQGTQSLADAQQKLVAVGVKGFNGDWVTKPNKIQEIYRPTGPDPTITVTCTANHSLTLNDIVVIDGAGPIFDGIFRVESIGGPKVFEYKYRQGPFTLSTSGTSVTGRIGGVRTKTFRVWPCVEERFDILTDKQTKHEDGYGIVAGVTQNYFGYSISTTIPHRLHLGDAFILTTGQGVPLGLFKVYEVKDEYTFEFYSHQAKTDQPSNIKFLDLGWEDSLQESNLDYSSTDRFKIQSLGMFYPPMGYILLRRDSGMPGTRWGFLSLDVETPIGTDIYVLARTAPDLETLENYGPDDQWGEKLRSGSYIDKQGRFIEFKVVLATADPTRTPILEGLHVAYQLVGEEEDFRREVSWNEFTPSPFVIFSENTQAVQVDNKNVAALAVQNTKVTYPTDGSILLSFDTGGLNEWVALTLQGSIPNIPGGSPSIEVKYRLYNRPWQKSTVNWSEPVVFTPTSSNMSVALNQPNKRYGDFLITLKASPDRNSTPILSAISVDWNLVVRGTDKYLYTTNIQLPENLKSIIITAATKSNVDGIDITYGITSKTYAGNFDEDYEIIEPNKLVKLTQNHGKFPRIAVRLYSSNPNEAPSIEGLGFQLNTVNGMIFNINEEDL